MGSTHSLRIARMRGAGSSNVNAAVNLNVVCAHNSCRLGNNAALNIGKVLGRSIAQERSAARIPSH